MISNECREILKSTSNRLPIYANRLANHLPMALIALDRMGSSTTQMQRFADAYLPKLVEFHLSSFAVTPPVILGTGFGFEGVYRYFLEKASEDGVDLLLRKWFPILIPGIAASAFHAFIRLAYAVEAKNELEICSALAYWIMEFRAFPLHMSPVQSTPETIISELCELVKGYQFAPGIIIDRMVEMSVHPLVQSAYIQPTDITLAQIARFALSVHLHANDFVTIHLITSCHAYRLVEKYLDDSGLSLRYLWQSVAIAYLTTKRVYFEAGATERFNLDGSSWAACIDKANCSLDEHVIKLTYSAWQESLFYNDSRYLEVARRTNFE